MAVHISEKFSSAEEFEKWLNDNEHGNKEFLDKLCEKDKEKWDNKACKMTVKDGKLQLLCENGNVLAEADYYQPDSKTVKCDGNGGKLCVKGIEEKNGKKTFSMWIGTQEEYNNIRIKDNNTMYYITDDQTFIEIAASFDNIYTEIEKIKNGETKVKSAEAADNATNADNADNADNAGNSKKLDNKPLSYFRGNGTGYVYPVLSDTDLNTIHYEFHGFIIRGINAPSDGMHGFLDVDHFDGEAFAPNGDGKEPVVRQRFTPYNSTETYTRLINAHSTHGFTEGWRSNETKVAIINTVLSGTVDISSIIPAGKTADDIVVITACLDKNEHFLQGQRRIKYNSFGWDFNLQGVYCDDFNIIYTSSGFIKIENNIISLTNFREISVSSTVYNTSELESDTATLTLYFK